MLPIEFNVTLGCPSPISNCIPPSLHPSNRIMDPLNLAPSVWPLEGEDDPGLCWRGGMNSGLPTDLVLRSTSTDLSPFLTFLF